MFERELLLLKSYIEDLEHRPTWNKSDEIQKLGYATYVANEVMERLLTEETELPLYIPDRMPSTAKEIVESYISELSELEAMAEESTSKDVYSHLLESADTILYLLETEKSADELYTCQDVFTGRYFKSNIAQVSTAIDKLNDELQAHGSVALNTYFHHLGIPGIKIGYNFVWDSDRVEKVQAQFNPGESEDGRHKCLYVDFTPYPELQKDADGAPWVL